MSGRWKDTDNKQGFEGRCSHTKQDERTFHTSAFFNGQDIAGYLQLSMSPVTTDRTSHHELDDCGTRILGVLGSGGSSEGRYDNRVATAATATRWQQRATRRESYLLSKKRSRNNG